MKALNKTTLKIAMMIVTMSITTGAFAQSCYLETEPRVRVSDNTTQSKKQLWNACIDKQLAFLDPAHPNFFELGQQIGDQCTSARIICE